MVVALYVFEWFRLLLDEHDAEHRLLLQITAVGATVGFAFNAWRSEDIARPAWGVASATSLVGLGACIAGYVPLAVLLIEGIVASAFVAVALLRATLGADRPGGGRAHDSVRPEHDPRPSLRHHPPRDAADRQCGLLPRLSLDHSGLLPDARGRPRACHRQTLSESVQLGELDISLGEVLAFGLGIWAAVLISRVLSAALEEDVGPRLELGPGVPAAAALVVRYTVLAIGFLLAAAAAGIGLSQLALFAGALGVGVGFGLQNVVSNFVSGLLLVFGRPVKVGDTIDIVGFRGTITKIGIRSSTIRSLTGADVIIPNSKLIESELVNWTHDDESMRVDVPVGVAYGSDLQKVHSTLLETAKSLDFVLDRPPPAVLMTGFGDSSIDFRVQIWIAHPLEMPKAQSKLSLAIDEALAAANIEIPFPQRDLHIRSDATKAR